MYAVFWWARIDWVKYKVPLSDGASLLPHDFTVPGFEPGLEHRKYSYVHDRRDKGKVADFAAFDDALFFVNQRAFDCFKDIFSQQGRAFPIQCDGKPHYLVLVDTVLDAIDLERSEFRRSDLDEDLLTDISGILKMVLKQRFSTDRDIFRLAGSFALGNYLVVSNRFKVRYQEARLTGLFFLPTDGG